MCHGLQFDGEFDENKGIHEGRLVTSEDIPVTGADMSVDIHDVEDEDN